MIKAVKFLNYIGITCAMKNGATGFLPFVRIVEGKIFFDPRATVSDVLHEAGHLAVLPKRFRERASDDIDEIVKTMSRDVDFSNPDSPEARAALQCGDCEATAWAWAAGLAAGIPKKQIIKDNDFAGEGKDIRLCLERNSYLGIHGLAAAGFCVTRPYLEKHSGKPAFPKLVKWLQD